MIIVKPSIFSLNTYTITKQNKQTKLNNDINDIKDAAVGNIDPDIPFVVETDASDYAIAVTLNQNGRPVAFFTRSLRPNEIKHHPVEKEACAIVASLLSWKHYLVG